MSCQVRSPSVKLGRRAGRGEKPESSEKQTRKTVGVRRVEQWVAISHSGEKQENGKFIFLKGEGWLVHSFVVFI